MLINGTSAARTKSADGGAQIPKMLSKMGGGGASKLSAAQRDRRRAL